MNTFEKGKLKAIGYIRNKAVMEDVVSTSGKANMIKLTYDKSNKKLRADGADVVFVYATICDSEGNTVTGADDSIQFTVTGSGKIIGQNPINAEAGIATILLQAGNTPKEIVVEAKSTMLISGKIKIPVIK